jgi:LAS superfamily LD-carboxypeptidase LdcB
LTDLSTLTVRLEAETSQYQQQLAAATKQLQAFQSNVADFAEDLTKKFAAAFTVDKIAEFIENAIESAAALERLSQESGIAVEELSALAAVFAQSGVGQDEMSASLKKLNQAISDAAGNATSKAAFAFQALGLSITNSNGSLKTAGQLLPEIADAYSRLADGPNKVAINIDLLGRSANGLIPTLDKGRQGLDDLQAAAIASGAAMSGDLAKAAEDLETKFIALKQSATGTLQTEVLQASIPTLNAFADGLSAIAKVASDSSGIFSAFTNVVLKPLGTVLLSLDVGLRDFGAEFTSVAQAIDDAAHGKFAQAWADLSGGLNNVVAVNTAGVDAVVNLWKSGGHSMADIMDETAKIIEAKANATFASLKDASSQGVSPEFEAQLSAAQKKVEDFAASIKVQTDSFDKGIAAQTALKLSTGALGDAVALAHKTLTDFANSTAPGSDALRKYAQDTLNAADAAQKLSVQQQAQIDTKTVSDYTDKLQEQVDKLNLGTLAATAYATTHGKLGSALRDTAIDGAAATAKIVDLTKQLVEAGNEKTLADLSTQALTLEGHLVEAADAAFAFQSKLQKANAGSVGDTKLLNQIDQTHALTVAQAAFNEQVEKANVIQLQLSTTETDVAAQQAAGQITDLQAQAKLQDARATAITQLNQIAVAEQNIATSSGIPKLTQQTQAFQNSITQLASQQDALTKQIRGDLEDSLVNPLLDAETGAKSLKAAFSDMIQSIEKDLLTIANKNIAESIFGTAGPGGGISSALAGLFGGGAGNGLSSGANSAIAATANSSTDDALAALAGGGLASGGKAMAGMSYTVGEHGAEEFIPDTNGTIVPNSKMSGGHTIINHFVIQSQNGQISRPSQMQTAAAVARSVGAASARNNR